MELIMDAPVSQEVPVSAMAASDEIVLVTGNSTYRVLVEDPAERRGLLRGGRTAVGQTAYFCGILEGAASFRSSTLRAGSRALFLVQEPTCCRRFLTSKLVEVHVIRSRER